MRSTDTRPAGRHQRRCANATVWWLATLLLAAAQLAATPAAAQEPPQFLIERITVEGVARPAAQQIVRSESRLEEAHTYTEQQLRQAVYRVKRLPFVVDADMALRRGSERGAYELVITVEGVKPVAFGLEAVGHLRGGRRLLHSSNDYVALVGTLTARRFVGGKGLLFGSFQTAVDDRDRTGSEVMQLGYTRYGLFAPGGFASIAVSSALGRDSGDNLQASLELGVPLAANHALRFGLARTWVDARGRSSGVSGLPIPTDFHFDSYQGQVSWIYDSTDDPLFATEGSRTTVDAAYAHERQRVSGGVFSGDEINNTTVLLGAQGRRYWRLTPRQSVAVDGEASHSQQGFGGNGGFGFNSRSNRFDQAALTVIHAASLWNEERRARLGDLRLETGLGASRSTTHEPAFGPDEHRTTVNLDTAVIFRNAWGLVKLGFRYIYLLRGGR
ncbi:MAG TPA: BamA/TamA family outer membrane protein [Thermoanaerobaculia bacterium]|jgi:hypothetical protein|nr:BamA/TamA family outer membrane protein [Thermoanaerobaculia bacterium]